MVGRVKFGVSAIGAITVAAAGITLPLVEGPSASAAGLTVVRATWSDVLSNTNARFTQSAPILASLGGHLNVVAGDNQGKVSAADLTAGGSLTENISSGGTNIVAPLSSDGTNVYVPHNSANGVPTVNGFSAAHALQPSWSGFPCDAGGGPCDLVLSGGAVNGSTIVTGGPSQNIRGANTSDGSPAWSFLSTDSTNSTPAVADLYGTGTPVSIFADDQSPNSQVNPPAQAGGHIRIMTQNGQQVCNYNVSQAPLQNSFSSSPAVSLVAGAPMIVVGTGDSGSYPNQLLFLDDACHLLGTSPPLSGPTVASPAIVDLYGNGHPYAVIETSPNSGNATLYAIDMAAGNGQFPVAAQVTLPACAATAGSSVVAANVPGLNPSGVATQTIFAPASPCSPGATSGLMVVDLAGQSVLKSLGTADNQNTPVLNIDSANALGVTTAANSPTAEIDHWTIPARAAVSIGWGEFHHDATLSGTAGSSSARDAIAATGGSEARLSAGQTLTSLDGASTATMQADGNLVVTGAHPWTSGTNQAGSYLSVTATSATIKNASGIVVSTLWSGSHTGPLVLQMQNDGHLGLSAADSTDAGHERWGNDLTFWRSGLPTPTITFNPSLSGYRTGTQSVTATSNGTAPVVISSESPSVCWVDTSTSPATARFLAAGNCVLDANEVADTSYNAAAQVQRTIVISPSPPTAPTAVAPTSGSAKLAAGKPYTFTGKLTTNGVPLANGRVMIMIRNVGTTGWALKKTVSSDANGAVSFTFTPVRNTQMMWQFAATNAYGASDSSAAVREVDVQPRISIAETKATIAKGTLTRFWGAMTPGFTGELITLQELVKGKWVTLKVAVRVKLQKLPNGKTAYGYVMPYKGTTKGRFAYRVMIHRDNNFLAAVSPLIYLRIT